MSNAYLVSRRGFLEGLFSAGALIVAAPLVPQILKGADADNAAFHPSVYVGIEPDGKVIIVAHRSEMGTGIRTTLPMVLADELEADWKRVQIEQAIGDRKYGSQNTDGSVSIVQFYEPFRVAGATARTMLEGAAASKWGVPASECQAKNHEVVHAGSGRKLGFGELVADAAKQPVPKREDLRLKSPAEFRYIGKDNVQITDLDAIVTGQRLFGMDAKVPDMLYASVEHPPVLGGKVATVDDSEALKVKGVSKTVQIEGFKGSNYFFNPLGGVAVIADNTWAAFQGRKKLKIDWDLGPHATYDSVTYKKELQETARKPGRVERQTGDVDAAFAKANQDHRGRILRAASGACSHGAAGRDCRLPRWKGDRLGADSGSAGGSNHRRAGRRCETAGRHLPCDSARRRLRAQIETRLLRRSGDSLQAARQAGQGGVEPRRRSALRLFPLRRGLVHEGGGE